MVNGVGRKIGKNVVGWIGSGPFLISSLNPLNSHRSQIRTHFMHTRGLSRVVRVFFPSSENRCPFVLGQVTHVKTMLDFVERYIFCVFRCMKGPPPPV